MTAELKVFTGLIYITYRWSIIITSSLSYNCHRPTATSSNPGWYLVRLGWGESWKLIGWCFGAPWAATGSLLRQFESSSTSAERKQQTNCWTTNKQTNNVYSLTVQCWFLTSCLVHLRVKVQIKVKKRWITSFRWIHMETIVLFQICYVYVLNMF